MMANPKVVDVDVDMEDDYDEEADSDFDVASAASAGPSSSSSDEEDEPDRQAPARPRKRRKIQESKPAPALELDSGDEATVQEHKKMRRRQRRKAGGDEGASEAESEGWRARTRAMREREKEDKKLNKLASVKDSTVDVDRLWEEMNTPNFRPEQQPEPAIQQEDAAPDVSAPKSNLEPAANKENNSEFSEMITIQRTYKFAGEVHTEEKTVPKSSAEARLWLAQQSSKPQARDSEGRVVHRPLRKISRFDPNAHNLDSFKGSWTTLGAGQKGPNGPKLNVVEKSKMDWAVHVDAEGLKEELDTHAKAKEGYMHRMDFLRDVEQRKEDEARAARLQGR